LEGWQCESEEEEEREEEEDEAGVEGCERWGGHLIVVSNKTQSMAVDIPLGVSTQRGDLLTHSTDLSR